MICPECKCEVPRPCWEGPSYTYKGCPLVVCGKVEGDKIIGIKMDEESDYFRIPAKASIHRDAMIQIDDHWLVKFGDLIEAFHRSIELAEKNKTLKYKIYIEPKDLARRAWEASIRRVMVPCVIMGPLFEEWWKAEGSK